MNPFVLASTHARVCKERDEARTELAYWLQRLTLANDTIRSQRVELRNANAKLERFTGPRQRDEKGLFLPSKVRS